MKRPENIIVYTTLDGEIGEILFLTENDGVIPIYWGCRYGAPRPQSVIEHIYSLDASIPLIRRDE